MGDDPRRYGRRMQMPGPFPGGRHTLCGGTVLPLATLAPPPGDGSPRTGESALNFRSIAQLSDQLLHWSRRLPRDIELVVGVPRSGLLAGNLLALYLNVPLTDLDGFLAGRCFESGSCRRKRFAEGGGTRPFLDIPRTVLVLDDSLWGGGTMRSVREKIDGAGLPHRLLYGAVYVAPGKESAVDFHCEALNGPRVFEWNVLDGELLRQFCVSLEGVLCPRPPAGRAQDPVALRHIEPYLVPAVEIGWIISERPERQRPETEAWLHAHAIEYKNLIMAGDRQVDRLPAAASAHKADAYRSTEASLFLEASLGQAIEIARLSGRPVLCTDAMQMVYPGTMPLPRADQIGDLHPPSHPFPRKLKRLLRR
jgi:orotate phosphoribosyltransferase